jgi:hypothetical protein
MVLGMRRESSVDLPYPKISTVGDVSLAQVRSLEEYNFELGSGQPPRRRKALILRN